MDEKSNVIDITEKLAKSATSNDVKPKIFAPKFSNPIMKNFAKFMNSSIKAKFKLEDLFR